VFMFLSADMYFANLESLREVVDADQYKIIFCTTIEFWIDMTRVRLYSADTDVLTVPSNILQPLAIDSSYAPYCEENGSFQLEGASHNDRILLPQTIKYHLGWIRPFSQQVQKHICHVKQHRWGELGEKLLQGSDRAMDQQWIKHVMSYEGIPSIAFSGALPPELEQHKDMRFDDGADEVQKEFERKYNVSLLRAKGEE